MNAAITFLIAPFTLLALYKVSWTTNHRMHDDDNDDPSNLGSKSWQEEHSIISATLTESIDSTLQLVGREYKLLSS